MTVTQQLQLLFPNHERVVGDFSRASDCFLRLYPSTLDFFTTLAADVQRQTGKYPVLLASTPGARAEFDSYNDSKGYSPDSAGEADFSVFFSHYGTMGLVTNVLSFVFAVSFLTFVAFFGRLPIFRRTPIGFAHRAIWVYIPKILGKIDAVLTGGRLGWYVIGGWNRLLYGKHPVVLVRLHFEDSESQINRDTDIFPRSRRRRRFPLPPVNMALPDGLSSHHGPVSGPPTVHLDISLQSEHSKLSSHHNSRLACRAHDSVSVRLQTLSPERGMQNLPVRQTCPVKTLFALQSLCCTRRSPLHMGE
jgi:hypothetical protein